MLYHRLVLVVGPAGAGKTTALREVAKHTGFGYINVGLDLSQRLLELTERQRLLRVSHLLDELTGKGRESVVLLNNTELLFDVTLKQDPLPLLATVVAQPDGRRRVERQAGRELPGLRSTRSSRVPLLLHWRSGDHQPARSSARMTER